MRRCSASLLVLAASLSATKALVVNGTALVNEGFTLFRAGKIAEAWNAWDEA